MSKKLFLLFCSALICIVIIAGITSVVEDDSYKMIRGKNVVSLNLTNPLYVETLVKLNPEIEVVSFFQENQNLGYINLFEGIGDNFVIQEGVYEIIAKQDFKLLLPEQ
ncbi:hypothetical protein GOV14_01850 [Candidatus Pacearchaeota archaeon]|nr:hypothetical protein [Candidatus Pacearchaeota archaeon]